MTDGHHDHMTWQQRQRVARVLRAAASDARSSIELEHHDGPHLQAAATTHRVTGYVERLLSATGASGALRPEVVAELAAATKRATVAHLRALADLDRLRSLLDERGVRWCVFKGPVVAELLHDHPGLRPYTDLDVLVHPADIRVAVGLLEDSGAQVLDAHWRTLLAWQHAQVHVRLWSGTTLDLHWHLINEWHDRDAFTLDTAGVLERARRVDLGGIAVATLDPVDTLINLCVHAATAGGQRLSWLCDIRLAARTPDLDAAELVDRTARSGTRLVTATMLCTAATVLGDPRLLALGRTLAPSEWWIRVAVAVAHASPAPRWRGAHHVTLGWVLCRSTRESVGRSVVIALRNGPRLLRRWATTERSRAALRPVWGGVRDLVARDRRRAGVLPGDGPYARDAYFDWVASSAGTPRPAPPDAPDPSTAPASRADARGAAPTRRSARRR